MADKKSKKVAAKPVATRTLKDLSPRAQAAIVKGGGIRLTNHNETLV